VDELISTKNIFAEPAINSALECGAPSYNKFKELSIVNSQLNKALPAFFQVYRTTKEHRKALKLSLFMKRISVLI
jgi:hypothetical protein